MKKNLILQNPRPDLVQSIIGQTGCHPVTARILANRGITSQPAINDFFHPSLNQIRAFGMLADMDAAVDRITHALLHHEKILVFGDYDVDGVTATTLLHDFLRAAGGDVAYYIPHRTREGYGLTSAQIDGVVVSGKFRLVITVDCGSSSHDAVRKAREAGIDVIVTDHHGISGPLPQAAAVVNPKRPDCPSGADYLAGVGVAFCLLIRLRRHLRKIRFWETTAEPNLLDFCDLVALGTIADVVPLIHDNRIMTRAGLEVINARPRPGIAALIQASGIHKTVLDAEDIAFRLCPRLNAAGRLEHADLAVRLLQAQTRDAAVDLAKQLNGLNSKRQEVEQKILEQILRYLNDTPEALKGSALVMGKADWHEGVLGVVASRLVDKFQRPVVLVSFHGDSGKGSGRGIPGLHLYDALGECADLLETFGGHAMAAGLRVKKENFPRFRECFDTAVAARTRGRKPDQDLSVDAPLSFDMINDQLMAELALFQPFGQDNPEPLFCAENVRVTRSQAIGNGHRRLFLAQKSSPALLQAVWFHVDPQNLSLDHFDNLVFKLRWNHWNGKTSVQALVENA